MKIKMLTIMMAAALGAQSVAAAEDIQGSGTVTFTGAIIDAPCSIDPDSTSQEVDLGQISMKTLADGGNSRQVGFQIKLLDCQLVDNGNGTDPDPDGDGSTRAEEAPRVAVTFGGQEAISGKEDWFAIVGQGQGAGVVILDSANNQIPVNGTTTPQNLIVGDNTLSFAAYLHGLDNDGLTLSTGEFYSIADFTLAYN